MRGLAAVVITSLLVLFHSALARTISDWIPFYSSGSGPFAFAEDSDPSAAVFEVVVTDRDAVDGKVKVPAQCTGFFVSKDGTAFTNSHCASWVAKEPTKYRMVAIVGKEFYDAQVICASRLDYDPITYHGRVPFAKDVAQIKLVPSDAYGGKKNEFYYFFKDGTKMVLATAHTGPLPEFPFLTVGGYPQGHVRVIGFGKIGAIPEKWTAEGQVARSWHQNGIEGFSIEMDSGRGQPGNSGSPVLNDQNQVVGLWTWSSPQKNNMGDAQSNEVLRNGCQ